MKRTGMPMLAPLSSVVVNKETSINLLRCHTFLRIGSRRSVTSPGIALSRLIQVSSLGIGHQRILIYAFMVLAWLCGIFLAIIKWLPLELQIKTSWMCRNCFNQSLETVYEEFKLKLFVKQVRCDEYGLFYIFRLLSE